MRQRALGFTSMPNSDLPRPERERERERENKGGSGKNIIMQARYVNISPAYIIIENIYCDDCTKNTCLIFVNKHTHSHTHTHTHTHTHRERERERASIALYIYIHIYIYTLINM